MGHSRAEKAESRERILDAAARQIRQGGLESVSIAELMKAANLTHGGFYGHFSSRTALIAAALERAMDKSAAVFIEAKTTGAASTVKSIVNRYLSGAHRDNAAEGCAIAALACDVGRAEDQAVRDLMAQRLERSIEEMSQAMGGGPQADEAAVVAWCAMVGAIALSRVFADTKRADGILHLTRHAVLDTEARVRAAG